MDTYHTSCRECGAYLDKATYKLCDDCTTDQHYEKPGWIRICLKCRAIIPPDASVCDCGYQNNEEEPNASPVKVER